MEQHDNMGGGFYQKRTPGQVSEDKKNIESLQSKDMAPTVERQTPQRVVENPDNQRPIEGAGGQAING